MNMDTSTVFHDIVNFYDGMREYWSTRTLMEGYGEAAKDITELVEDATRKSNPLVQACAGSGLAVAKMLGAIPIGIDHWVIETARSTVRHGWGAGFKTLLGTPMEGFIGGGKFVVHQVKNWSQGEISVSTMGVADEVTTTLGTLGLMFLGIKAIHSGGTGVVNGIKNFEIFTPISVNGQAIPTMVIPAGMEGFDSLAMGLVYMSSANHPPGRSAKEGKVGSDIKKDFRRDELFELDVETVVKMSGLPELRSTILAEKIASGDLNALQALLQLIKEGDRFPQNEFIKLVMRNPYFETALKREVWCELIKLNDSRVMMDMNGLHRILEELKPLEPNYSTEPQHKLFFSDEAPVRGSKD